MRQHMTVIELEYPDGYRFWTRPLPADQAVALAYDMIDKAGLYWSYIGCAEECWCLSDLDATVGTTPTKGEQNG